MQRLPIDELVSEIARQCHSSGALLLTAEPGAGKTTRVPWALHEARPERGEVVVTEPRRLAARMAARYVAGERGERLGGRVGYSVRFEDVTSAATRVRYVTEGLLLRRLIAEPALPGVATVVLDEFHERHLESDLLLALLARLRRTTRPDLELVVMSATLEAEPIARFLGDAPIVSAPGRVHPLTIEHQGEPDDRPLEKQVASAVRRAFELEPSGDVLVFLPGAGEIRKSAETLEGLARERGFLVVPLHGDLPIDEQSRAVTPGARPRVVLSTNVAESSLTIEGVRVVIDSGLARQKVHSAFSGLGRLATVKISQASAKQRAGRAGRLGPGRVLRLFTSGDLKTRPEQDIPEILRSDLAEASLLLATLHATGSDFSWLTPPPETGLAAARELLELLGAVDQGGNLTSVGDRMLALPLHPRLARVVIEGERRGVARDAALLALLIGERDLRSEARVGFGRGAARELGHAGPSDLLELAERFDEAEAVRFEPRRVASLGLDPRAVAAVARGFEQLARLVRDHGDPPPDADHAEAALLIATFCGFADRLARRREPGKRELILANGKSARLSEQSVVHHAPLFVAVDVDERPGRGVEVRWASAVDERWLLELFETRIALDDELVWNAERERVERRTAMRFGAVVLDESSGPAEPSPGAAELLTAAARQRPDRFLKSDRALSLLARTALLSEHYPDQGFPSDPETLLDRALEGAAESATSFAELEAFDLIALVESTLPGPARRLLAEQTPVEARLPGGRVLKVHYELGKTPFIASRLQDFFGSADGPRILGGRLPLTVHLLAPNQRPVQVTSDLSGFWQRHYPSVRRELMRRYPRHAWPEDGASAAPEAPRAPRRRS